MRSSDVICQGPEDPGYLGYPQSFTFFFFFFAELCGLQNLSSPIRD